jgi:hypothetical protein
MTLFNQGFVRFRRLLLLSLLSLLLAGCLTQILVSATKEVMWRLLLPMVGLDPNTTNLFEQPMVKDRMTALLGTNYEPVIGMLKTADQLQQEGPLFYVVSRYTPVPEFAEKAGLVWDSDANRMAVMLVSGGSPNIIAEQVLQQQIDKQVGQAVVNGTLRWPGELQSILDEDTLKQQQLPDPTIDALESEIKAQEEAGIEK